MTTLSNEAFAVMAACERTKQPFGITVDKNSSGQYKFVWAFKIDKEKAQREGYDKTNIKGNITLDAEYPGCPYCGENDTLFAHHAISFSATIDKSMLHVPTAEQVGHVVSVEQVDLKGGGY